MGKKFKKKVQWRKLSLNELTNTKLSDEEENCDDEEEGETTSEQPNSASQHQQQPQGQRKPINTNFNHNYHPGEHKRFPHPYNRHFDQSPRSAAPFERWAFPKFFGRPFGPADQRGSRRRPYKYYGRGGFYLKGPGPFAGDVGPYFGDGGPVHRRKRSGDEGFDLEDGNEVEMECSEDAGRPSQPVHTVLIDNEYTKIQTPRQEVIFKKSSLDRKTDSFDMGSVPSTCGSVTGFEPSLHGDQASIGSVEEVIFPSPQLELRNESVNIPFDGPPNIFLGEPGKPPLAGVVMQQAYPGGPMISIPVHWTPFLDPGLIPGDTALTPLDPALTHVIDPKQLPVDPAHILPVQHDSNGVPVTVQVTVNADGLPIEIEPSAFTVSLNTLEPHQQEVLLHRSSELLINTRVPSTFLPTEPLQVREATLPQGEELPETAEKPLVVHVEGGKDQSHVVCQSQTSQVRSTHDKRGSTPKYNEDCSSDSQYSSMSEASTAPTTPSGELSDPSESAESTQDRKLKSGKESLTSRSGQTGDSKRLQSRSDSLIDSETLESEEIEESYLCMPVDSSSQKYVDNQCETRQTVCSIEEDTRQACADDKRDKIQPIRKECFETVDDTLQKSVDIFVDKDSLCDTSLSSCVMVKEFNTIPISRKSLTDASLNYKLSVDFISPDQPQRQDNSWTKKDDVSLPENRGSHESLSLKKETKRKNKRSRKNRSVSLDSNLSSQNSSFGDSKVYDKTEGETLSKYQIKRSAKKAKKERKRSNKEKNKKNGNKKSLKPNETKNNKASKEMSKTSSQESVFLSEGVEHTDEFPDNGKEDINSRASECQECECSFNMSGCFGCERLSKTSSCAQKQSDILQTNLNQDNPETTSEITEVETDLSLKDRVRVNAYDNTDSVLNATENVNVASSENFEGVPVLQNEGNESRNTQPNLNEDENLAKNLGENSSLQESFEENLGTRGVLEEESTTQEDTEKSSVSQERSKECMTPSEEETVSNLDRENSSQNNKETCLHATPERLENEKSQKSLENSEKTENTQIEQQESIKESDSSPQQGNGTEHVEGPYTDKEEGESYICKQGFVMVPILTPYYDPAVLYGYPVVVPEAPPERFFSRKKKKRFKKKFQEEIYLDSELYTGEPFVATPNGYMIPVEAAPQMCQLHGYQYLPNMYHSHMLPDEGFVSVEHSPYLPEYVAEPMYYKMQPYPEMQYDKSLFTKLHNVERKQIEEVLQDCVSRGEPELPKDFIESCDSGVSESEELSHLTSGKELRKETQQILESASKNESKKADKDVKGDKATEEKEDKMRKESKKKNKKQKKEKKPKRQIMEILEPDFSSFSSSTLRFESKEERETKGKDNKQNSKKKKYSKEQVENWDNRKANNCSEVTPETKVTTIEKPKTEKAPTSSNNNASTSKSKKDKGTNRQSHKNESPNSSPSKKAKNKDQLKETKMDEENSKAPAKKSRASRRKSKTTKQNQDRSVKSDSKEENINSEAFVIRSSDKSIEENLLNQCNETVPLSEDFLSQESVNDAFAQEHDEYLAIDESISREKITSEKDDINTSVLHQETLYPPLKENDFENSAIENAHPENQELEMEPPEQTSSIFVSAIPEVSETSTVPGTSEVPNIFGESETSLSSETTTKADTLLASTATSAVPIDSIVPEISHVLAISNVSENTGISVISNQEPEPETFISQSLLTEREPCPFQDSEMETPPTSFEEHVTSSSETDDSVPFKDLGVTEAVKRWIREVTPEKAFYLSDETRSIILSTVVTSSDVSDLSDDDTLEGDRTLTQLENQPKNVQGNPSVASLSESLLGGSNERVALHTVTGSTSLCDVKNLYLCGKTCVKACAESHFHSGQIIQDTDDGESVISNLGRDRLYSSSPSFSFDALPSSIEDTEPLTDPRVYDPNFYSKYYQLGVDGRTTPSTTRSTRESTLSPSMEEDEEVDAFPENCAQTSGGNIYAMSLAAELLKSEKIRANMAHISSYTDEGESLLSLPYCGLSTPLEHWQALNDLVSEPSDNDFPQRRDLLCSVSSSGIGSSLASTPNISPAHASTDGTSKPKPVLEPHPLKNLSVGEGPLPCRAVCCSVM